MTSLNSLLADGSLSTFKYPLYILYHTEQRFVIKILQVENVNLPLNYAYAGVNIYRKGFETTGATEKAVVLIRVN